jgi:hypothetical protein
MSSSVMSATSMAPNHVIPVAENSVGLAPRRRMWRRVHHRYPVAQRAMVAGAGTTLAPTVTAVDPSQVKRYVGLVNSLPVDDIPILGCPAWTGLRFEVTFNGVDGTVVATVPGDRPRCGGYALTVCSSSLAREQHAGSDRLPLRFRPPPLSLAEFRHRSGARAGVPASRLPCGLVPEARASTPEESRWDQRAQAVQPQCARHGHLQ